MPNQSSPPVLDINDNLVMHINMVITRLDSFSEKLDKLDVKQEKLLEETSQLSGSVHLLNHRINSVEQDVRSIRSVELSKFMNDISTNKLNLAQLENKVNNYDSGWSKFFDVLKIFLAAIAAFLFGLWSKILGSSS